MEVSLGRLELAGRGIVTPWVPYCSWSWEFRASSRREEMGRRVAKSTYSLLVMAVIIALAKWLASGGCWKSRWRVATTAGSDRLKAGKVGGGVAAFCCCCWPSPDGLKAGKACGSVVMLCFCCCCCCPPLDGLKARKACSGVATLCCCGWPPSEGVKAGKACSGVELLLLMAAILSRSSHRKTGDHWMGSRVRGGTSWLYCKLLSCLAASFSSISKEIILG